MGSGGEQSRREAGLSGGRRRAGELLRLLGYEAKRVVLGVRHTASIDITAACNLRCRHCYYFRDPREIAEEPSLAVWEERFLGLRREGIRIALLLGGEPALRPEVLMAADRIFPFVDVISNGTVKIPPGFRHRIFLSIDGLQGTHDAIRGAGVFAKAIANYSGDSRVVVHMVLGRDNYRDLEGVARIVREHGFRGLLCGLYAPPPGREDAGRLSPEERAAIREEIRRVRDRHPAEVRMSDRMLSWYAAGHDARTCYWGRDVLHLDVAWRRKTCVGIGNCSECGCLGGAVGSPLNKLLDPGAVFRAMS